MSNYTISDTGASYLEAVQLSVELFTNR